MNVVSTTLCYPHPAAPTRGIFVQRRLAAIHRLIPLTVVAPVPWFPVLRPMPPGLDATGVVNERPETPPVIRPRMFYLPGIAKRWDADCFAQALLRGVKQATGGSPPDLIDAHFEWPDGVGAFRAARRLGVPVVCTLRGKLVSHLRRPAIAPRMLAMLLGADALIAVSRSLADLARQATGVDLKLAVIPNGIDRAVFRPPPHRATLRAELGWPADARVVVSVGHLQALKGFHRLVDVWPRVRQAVGEVRLILIGGEAGEPGYAARLRGQIEAAGLVESVVLAGRLDPPVVARLVGAADLFALATESEGWCNAIAEALACGTPVVTTDVGGNREIVHDATLGRLVPANDSSALAEAIIAELGREPDRAKIAAVGGGRDWQQVARECVDVWNTVLGRR